MRGLSVAKTEVILFFYLIKLNSAEVHNILVTFV